MIALSWPDEGRRDLTGSRVAEGPLAPVVPLRAAPTSQRPGGPRLQMARRRKVFWWRRLLVLVVTGLIGGLAWAGAQALLSALAGHRSAHGAPALSQSLALASATRPMSASGAPTGGQSSGTSIGLSSAGRPAAGTCHLAPLGPGQARACPGQYLVRPGDTIWAVAVRYSRGADPRLLADELESQIGGGVLQPGQVLRVP